MKTTKHRLPPSSDQLRPVDPSTFLTKVITYLNHMYADDIDRADLSILGSDIIQILVFREQKTLDFLLDKESKHHILICLRNGLIF